MYHQIIIGYLKYCKERGFVTCNIWACPPPKGENYIFYCHPNKQRVPSNEKLRDWYYKLLRRSKDYEIVADHVNVYDHFCMGEIERMRSATDLPYFDGDYFTTAAEDALAEIDKGQEPSKIKSIRKSASSKRNLNVNSWLKGDKERDAALMYKMGETVQQVKADFLYVLLQHECSWCSRTIAGELRSYVPGSSFNLCSECAEHNDSLPPHEKHQQPLEREYVEPLPDTRDPDGDIENEFFETRLQFLQLCQGNHFQFDSLRRAKYSSMMVLYHLHNPSEPALAFTCNICRRTIEPGTGARCEVCHDFDLCEECFYKYECALPPLPLCFASPVPGMHGTHLVFACVCFHNGAGTSTSCSYAERRTFKGPRARRWTKRGDATGKRRLLTSSIMPSLVGRSIAASSSVPL